MSAIRSPRGSLRLFPGLGKVVAIWEGLDAERLERAVEAVRLVSSVRHPSIPAALTVTPSDERLEVTYPLQPGTGTLPSSVEACRIVADIADGVATTLRISSQLPFGPHSPALLARTSGGSGQLLVPCLWGLAYGHDRGIRGRMSLRHFVESPESLGSREHSPRTETYYLAYALFEALTGREPFVHNDTFEYMDAIMNGRSLSLSELRPDLPGSIEAVLSAAFDPSESDRLDLEEFARALRAVSA
jgi:hypothetical protein